MGKWIFPGLGGETQGKPGRPCYTKNIIFKNFIGSMSQGYLKRLPLAKSEIIWAPKYLSKPLIKITIHESTVKITDKYTNKSGIKALSKSRMLRVNILLLVGVSELKNHFTTIIAKFGSWKNYQWRLDLERNYDEE